MFDADSHGSARVERALSRSLADRRFVGIAAAYQDTYPDHLPSHLSFSKDSPGISDSDQISPQPRHPIALTDLQYIDIREIPTARQDQSHLNQGRILPILLGEPGPRDHGKFLSQMPKKLWTGRDDHNRLLHRASGHVDGTMPEFARVDLPGTRDAKDRRGCAGGCGLAAEGKVGKIFRRAGHGQPRGGQMKGDGFVHTHGHHRTRP